MNRLRMQHRRRQPLSCLPEIERIEARRKKLIEMVMEGVTVEEVVGFRRPLLASIFGCGA
jgi:hypothetical protein